MERIVRMFAVVDIAGKQFTVTQNDKLIVPTLNQKVGAKIRFDKVMMVGDDKNIMVGNPLVAGAHVEATVLDHVKGPKLMVFKKKKRKGYRVKRGHRQRYTEVQISTIQR
jgi:large subunit ribosomal protein L21